ncbi:NAD(P)-binding domain-containing protein [Streptomyces sp. NPDC058420]|uniref:NAD(P)-binding domain-containing protein n=1 Tax=Streptomyces sp. NPDC058420 TaxID=3346489 RepID=UPI003666A061
MVSRAVAFVGPGHMGGPMAAHLVKSGHLVRGQDLVPAFLDAATLGLRAASCTPRTPKGPVPQRTSPASCEPSGTESGHDRAVREDSRRTHGLYRPVDPHPSRGPQRAEPDVYPDRLASGF